MPQVLKYDRNPINQFFEGSHFHHMHLEGNDTIGVYIPEELHRKNHHANWRDDKEKLKRINKEALLWLCKQEVIEGDSFDPEAEGTYVKVSKTYPINLKDKKLHHEFMGLGLDIDAKNVDQTLRYLLKSLEDLKKCKDENGSLEKKIHAERK